MTYRDIVVLYPSHGLEDFPTDLPDDKATGLLNAFAVAWHPALLAATESLPREQRADEPPTGDPGRLLIVPPASDELLPAGWLDTARQEGATVITGKSDRTALIEAVLEPLPNATPLDPDLVADFLALGTCRLLLELLTRRMHHFGPIEDEALRRRTIAAAQSAIRGDSDPREELRAAFEILTETRERFYPVECYLLDLCLLIPRLADEKLAAVIAGTKRINVLCTAADLAAIARDKPDLRTRLRDAWNAEDIDLLGGEWHERPVPLLPLSSTLREFAIGHEAFRQTMGRTPTIWARRRYGFSTLVPQILLRFGYSGALHVALDDGIYPDAEQSRTRWEGCDGSAVDATTRIPLAADSAASYLRFPTRMAESMQQDQTAAVIFARWPEVRTPFWNDFERIHKYGPVLGRFVTFRDFFEHSDDPGRLSRFQEGEYLSPSLIQAVAGREPDPVSRFRRHFERRAQLDAGLFLDALAAAVAGAPIGSSVGRSLEERLESSGPDLPSENTADQPAPHSRLDDPLLDTFVQQSARRLTEIIMHGAAREPGYLILNPLSFDRTVTVELPNPTGAESPEPRGLSPRSPSVPNSPIRAIQFDTHHHHVTLDVPGCGFAWIPAIGTDPSSKRSAHPKRSDSSMSEGMMIRNEFIEVHINEATGGIGRIKKFGRQPNRLSQQIAFRFSSERTVAGGQEHPLGEERTHYSQMRCSSANVTCSGPGLAEIVTTGWLADPQEGSNLADFRQTVRLWRGRPVIELTIDLSPTRLPDGDPWSNYFASRFAWNDSTATLTRSVLGTAHGLQWERFESPHFFEIATEFSRTTILNHGLPFHRKTGAQMLDSLLIAAGETARQFRFDIAIDADYPMQPAADALTRAVVLPTPNGPPTMGRSGWLFHVNAKNVQIVQILPLVPIPNSDESAGTQNSETTGSGAGGFTLRLVETEGRQRSVSLRSFRTPSSARKRDFRGHTLNSLKIIDDAVELEIGPHEIADVELHFGEHTAAS